jgi:hypothetical protein
MVVTVTTFQCDWCGTLAPREDGPPRGWKLHVADPAQPNDQPVDMCPDCWLMAGDPWVMFRHGQEA